MPRRAGPTTVRIGIRIAHDLRSLPILRLTSNQEAHARFQRSRLRAVPAHRHRRAGRWPAGRRLRGAHASANGWREATLYLPTRRAGRHGARDVSRRAEDATPRCCRASSRSATSTRTNWRSPKAAEQLGGAAPLEIPPTLGELERRLTLAQLVAAWAKQKPGDSRAAGGRRPGLDAGAGRRSGAADGRHGHARRRLGGARRAGAGRARPILAALAGIPAASRARRGRIICRRSAGSSRRRGATC